MSSREQNRAWAMTMAVAAVLAYTTGCTDNNSSSTAESTQTTAAISELEAESTTTDSEHSESTVATPLSDSEQRVDYDDDDKTSTYDTFDAEITLSGTTALPFRTAVHTESPEHGKTVSCESLAAKK